ncbi:MAG: TniQ family protein [Sulfurospirillaceae bacterium]|nr:TniQ family protein [Sulfurospirillaceae bacterium]
MIGFLPEIYTDELLYSWFARYYVRSGYSSYINAAEDLFERKTARPDVEFINVLNEDAKRIICSKYKIEELILKHTMFPAYGRFVNHKRRYDAFDNAINMKGDIHNLLAIPILNNGRERCIRYCPCCINEDREKYGETYWHRAHQILGVDICINHSCLLVDSNIRIHGKESPKLYAAEVVIDNSEIAHTNEVILELEINLSKYIITVFNEDINFDNQVRIGTFVDSRLEGTKYKSIRGEQRNIRMLYDDFIKFYQSLPNSIVKELWQIQKILNNDRLNLSEICQLAMFLNIEPEELVEMKLPETSQAERFDREVRRLHEEGMGYNKIGKLLNVSSQTVRRGCLDLVKDEKHETKKGKRKGAIDWELVDKQLLPRVKELARELYGNKEKPRRVTRYAICKIMNLPDKRFDVLPLCSKEIEKYSETQEEYWARLVIWAARKIMSEEKPLNWKQIRNLTNIKKENFEACKIFLDRYYDV